LIITTGAIKSLQAVYLVLQRGIVRFLTAVVLLSSGKPSAPKISVPANKFTKRLSVDDDGNDRLMHNGRLSLRPCFLPRTTILIQTKIANNNKTHE
jgi:hypothetical protein